MLQFWAILKDSFREAVDGYVIYVMLALSALVIVICGSMSFAPAPPEQAFDSIVGQFNMVLPEKGRSRVITGSSNDYKASDVRPEGGGYKLRLTVTARSSASVDGKHDPTQGDSFRSTVVSWAKPAEKGGEVDLDNPNQKGKGKGGRRVELGTQAPVSPEEQRAVTDAQMEEFVRTQFDVLAGMSATAKRVTAGVAEPTYAFDVTTTGGSAVKGWPHLVKIFFGAVRIDDKAPLGFTLWIIEDQLINGVGGALALLVSVIITAFFIPNMLRKGSVDLLVSKPIGRPALLVYKYVGGLIFIFLVSAFTIGGVWLVMAFRSGYWDPSFLIVIPVLTFSFAILYAVSVFAAVFTRSPIVAMLLSVGTAFFLWIVGKAKQWADGQRNEDRVVETPQWVFSVIDLLNNALPRYKDLDNLASKLIADGTLTPGMYRMVGLSGLDYPSWAAAVGVSLAFIAVLLAVSCWRFSKRDY